jgi:hypothetical protein
MKQVSFSRSCPGLFFNIPVHTYPTIPCGTDKAFGYIMEGAYKNQLSMNTLYELCGSHMQYFITLLIHQNYNSYIYTTSLTDMPIPINTYHSISLITATYATYIQIFRGSFVYCTLSLYIPVFFRHMTS